MTFFLLYLPKVDKAGVGMHSNINQLFKDTGINLNNWFNPLPHNAIF